MQRLNECFELIKQEVDTAVQDCAVYKAQRDEYEQQSK